MKKNAAGQVIGVQMTAASDGTEFTGAVTAYITGDGGSQAAGSVGSGACTHEGHGFHTYAPAQAETNFEHIAFTFAGTGAITATVQLYTQFPQTGDAFARVGAPAGASVSADVAALKTEADAIKAKTDNLPASPAAVGDIPTATENADALLDRDMSAGADSGSPTVRTVRQALRILRNKWSITSSTQSIKKEDDSTESWSQVLTSTAGADPVTGTDPAGP